jgi:ATP-binding cassette subfamily B multidrug efflux pump
MTEATDAKMAPAPAGGPARRPGAPAGPGGPPGGPGRGGMGFGMHGMAPAAKTKDFKGSFKRLGGYLKPHSAMLVLILVLAVISVTFNIIGPKVMAKATDLLFEGVISKQLPAGATKDQVIAGLNATGKSQLAEMIAPMDIVPGTGVDFAAIAQILLALTAIYLLSALFGWLQQYLMAGVAQQTVYGLRRQVDEKLARLPLKYFDDNARGDILSRVTNDIDNISNTLSQSATQIITAVLTIIGVLIMMFSISPLLASISLLVIPVSVVVTILIAKQSQKQFVAQWDRTGRLNGHVEEMHTGHNVVKVFGRQEEAIEVFDRENEGLYDASFKAQFISGTIQPALSFLNNLNYVGIAVIGGLGVANGTMSLGDVQAFIQYSRQFTQPIIQTASIANVLQSTIASAERVFELLDAEEELPETVTPKHLGTVQGHVEFKGIDFGYDPEQPLIKDLSLEAQPGHTVAIVGPTGAGKTTLVNLLMRFYELDGGSILVDGIDTRDLTRDELRRTFGMVLQDTWLFGGTIRENIAYGCEDATESEIEAAARMAYVEHFVRVLPEGYDTVLNDDVSNISQGQKQLLTIARAFLSDPRILILDEATSSVDTRTEALIQRAMTELMKNRTSFVIAHRLSTIRDADSILVMNEGQIIEQGTHDELIAKRGFYADLYNSQFLEPLDEAS